MNFKVDTKIDGRLANRIVFNSRTKAQKYILEKYKAFFNDKRFYISFTHYTKWGRFKKCFNDMCIDSMNVQTKDLVICVELSPI